ncbi:hypothetical protein Rhe02_55410 [Rhizocola hellebori]|uniref:Uncharacterized protein n=1 Tax=Rhizocola hellebori TaxID=1392758 RepID=A0A8J3QCV7_9ACTN|nr:hypothetical protein [Rhizocola hellebori]GIH07474.1 hypothetical protein Rhe02_55410 [Rhizocola hellebori]
MTEPAKNPEPLIVTVTATITDGQVVRWFTSEFSAKRVNSIVSASRNGVHIDAWLHEIPEGLLDKARDAWHALQRREDVKHLATHYSRFLSDDLVPIQPARD